ncbi:MAG: V/A-type H+-transporting ATPase subunit I [Candidatus Paceibacteria bacterium]|jgi:V/A-type H+-transporting ATPase subunit I
MSVVPMQKVRLSVYGSDVNQALSVVQKVSAIEFVATDISGMNEPDHTFPYADLLPRIHHALQFLHPYAPKVGLWKTLREGTRDELTEKELLKVKANFDVILPLVDDFERLQVEFTDVNEKLRQLEEQYILLSVWKDLPIKLNQLETSRTRTILVERNSKMETVSLKSSLEAVCVEQELPFYITYISDSNVALTLYKDREVILKGGVAITAVNGSIVTPPNGKETPDVEFMAVSDKLAVTKSELALLHDQAEHFARTHISQLRVAGEILSWQKSRFDVVGNALASKYVVFFDGWLNANKRADIESKFEKQNLAAVFTELELIEDEQPPVDIENSGIFKPFEAVTRLYGMPGYKDLDPTAFLAGFFFLFFGLSLTDVGYGAFLMIVSLIVLTLFKVAESLRLFAKLLFLVGLATVIVGALFGGYFGIPLESLPPLLLAIQMFDPIGNPLPVFYLALGLGVFQVMVGMLVKIYSEYKQGRLVTGILDQGPWFIMFCLAIFALATKIEYTSVLAMEQIINLIYVDIVLIVLSSGRKGETIFAKVKDSLSGLYDSIGYFSDILSYSRLLALGLATTALAFAVNMIASMVFNKESYISYIFAGAVLVIGHLFTLAVNTLGAFIHSARLQFVEFFGKFIEGTGKEFAPLSRTEKHVIIKDE